MKQRFTEDVIRKYADIIDFYTQVKKKSIEVSSNVYTIAMLYTLYLHYLHYHYTLSLINPITYSINQDTKIETEKKIEKMNIEMTKDNKNKDEEPKVGKTKKEDKEKVHSILPRWVHWVLGSVLFLSGSFAFYYLFRNKHKFLVLKSGQKWLELVVLISI